MSNLIVLEDGLVPVYQGDSVGEKLVHARELHEFLKVGKVFAAWIRDRLEKYELQEGVDYFPKTENMPGVGRPRKEYFLTMDTAKDIALAEDNKQGRAVRRYFIEVEKKYREQNNLPQMDMEELKIVTENQTVIMENMVKMNKKLNRVMKQMKFLLVTPSNQTSNSSKKEIPQAAKPSEEKEREKIRALINDKVLQYAEMTGLKTGQIYRNIYQILLETRGVDIQKRLETKRNQLNNRRLKTEGKPYSESALKNKLNGMDLVMKLRLEEDVLNIITRLIEEKESMLAAAL